MLVLYWHGYSREDTGLLKRLNRLREGWRQSSALQQHRQLLLLLPAVVPGDEGGLMYCHQLNLGALHHQVVANNQLANLSVVPKNKGPPGNVPLAFPDWGSVEITESDSSQAAEQEHYLPPASSGWCSPHQESLRASSVS